MDTATDHNVSITPAGGMHTATCTCGWAAHNGAMLTEAGAERARDIHLDR
jgi:hypothetical protein